MYVKRVTGAAFAAALGVSGLTIGAGLAAQRPSSDCPALAPQRSFLLASSIPASTEAGVRSS